LDEILSLKAPAEPTACGRFAARSRRADGETMTRRYLGITFPVAMLLLGLIPARVNAGTDGDYRALGYAYLSPVPRSEYVSPQTRFILIRLGPISPRDLANLSEFISVTGEVTGSHAGQARIAGDDRTVIFEMSSDFSRGELVTVTLTPTVGPDAGGVVEPFHYPFRISGPMGDVPPAPRDIVSAGFSGPWRTFDPDLIAQETLAQTPPPPAGNFEPQIMPNGVSVPSNFPHIWISVNSNPDPGFIFIDNGGYGDKSYTVIFDNTGSPVWYMRTPDGQLNMDVQPNGLLTMMTSQGGDRFIGLDTHYRHVADFVAVNGYTTDMHDLRVLKDGNYLLIGLAYETVDMSRYVSGGDTGAVVGETVIQEFTPAGELIFQWRAWDNFDVRDVEWQDIRSHSFKFPHMNAIDIDDDGHIVLSSRHLSEVTKIDRDTGEILWRLGGAHNEFTFVNDPLKGFRCQHAVRALGRGHYTMFDNGNLRTPAVSRGVEYQVDPRGKTATLVWQFRQKPDIYAYQFGNVQRLSNGNTLIGWGKGPFPKLTEVRPDGSKVFEMNWVDQWETYRVWRYPWQGKALKPELIIEQLSDSLALIFNQFGDPDVTCYRIYGGTSPQPTTLLATSVPTLHRLGNLENGRRYYFRVTAMNRSGTESDFSNEETVVVNIPVPGQNMIRNGDFSQGTESWTWALGGIASAQWMIENGVSHFDITSGGSSIQDIQLLQTGIGLIGGTNYIFEFDAWAQAPRIIEAKVEKNGSPWTNYGKIGFSYVTPQKKRFRYLFTMQDPSESDARVVVNTGTSVYDVYVDNLSLVVALPGDFDFDGCVGPVDLSVLTNWWLSEQTGLQADLDKSGRVDLGDFAILAAEWLTCL
jgi:hypothetical protein